MHMSQEVQDKTLNLRANSIDGCVTQSLILAEME